jgi:hypothetical protein
VRAETASPADAEALRAAMRSALLEAMARERVIVDKPGVGTLRVRSAITEVVRPNRALNVATSLLAAPLSRGAAAGEAEIVDAVTGRRLAALSWAGDGRILQPDRPCARRDAPVRGQGRAACAAGTRRGAVHRMTTTGMQNHHLARGLPASAGRR